MTNDALIAALSHLVSEGRNPETMDIDLLPSFDIVQRLNQQDKLVPIAVEKVLPEIAQAVDKITEAFKVGGRLFYIGAGTSGRLGVLDASECPPTFGTDPEMVVGIIAGGKEAMFRAKEGAEDDPELGEQDLKENALTQRDVVVGIAASGRTPYVIIGVPAHQAWMNNGKFDGGQLTTEQAQLRQYYISIMALNGLPAVVASDMAPLLVKDSDRVVGFVRSLGQQSLWVLSNFSQQAQTVTITLTPNQATMLKPNSTLYDLLESHNGILVSDEKQSTTFTLTLDALSSAVLTNKADHELYTFSFRFV